MMLWHVEPAEQGGRAVRAGRRRRKATTWGSVRAVGTDLFGAGLFPFEAISILLLVAVVGAIAIARPLQGRRPARATARRDPPGRAQEATRERRASSTSATATSWCSPPILFLIGMVGMLVRRNALIMLMSVELMLNAANMTLVVFSRMWGDLLGAHRSR